MHVLAQLLFLAGLVHGVRVDGVRVDAFVNWCTERGVTGFSPPGIVSIASTPTSGLGVFATAHVGAGEEILRVPMRLAISDRLLVGLDDTVARPPFEAAPWQATLASRMVDVADAYYQPWMDVLPSSVQGLEAAGHELQYAPAIAAYHTLRTERAELAARLAASGTADADAYERAISYAHTRAFLVELVAGDPFAACHAFVPAVDLFNHAAEDESAVEWTIDGGGADGRDLSMVVTTRRPVLRGEELTLCYEPGATNDDMCLYHGFVPSGNANDDVELFRDVDEAIAWHRSRFECKPRHEVAATAAMLASMPPLDGIAHMRRVGVASAGPRGAPLWTRARAIDPRLLAVFRLLSTEITPMPEDPARHAGAALAARCEEMLALWPTSLAEDLELLGCPASEINTAIADTPPKSGGTAISSTPVVDIAVTDAPISSMSISSTEGSLVGGEGGDGDGAAADGVATDALLACTLAESLRVAAQSTAAAGGKAAQPCPSSSLGVAVRYRAGKKRLLHAAMRWLKKE